MKGSMGLVRAAAAALHKGMAASASLGPCQASKGAAAGAFNHRKYSADTQQKDRSEKTGDIVVKIPVEYDLHLLECPPPQETTTSKEELMNIYKSMTVIRRVEIAADMVGSLISVNSSVKILQNIFAGYLSLFVECQSHSYHIF